MLANASALSISCPHISGSSDPLKLLRQRLVKFSPYSANICAFICAKDLRTSELVSDIFVTESVSRPWQFSVIFLRGSGESDSIFEHQWPKLSYLRPVSEKGCRAMRANKSLAILVEQLRLEMEMLVIFAPEVHSSIIFWKPSTDQRFIIFPVRICKSLMYILPDRRPSLISGKSWTIKEESS